MIEKLRIKIENELQITTIVGFVFMALGLFTFGFAGLVFFLGSYMPFEINILQNHFLAFFIGALIAVFIGFQIMRIQKFVDALLEIEGNKLRFFVFGKIKIARIDQVVSCKKRTSKKGVQLRIETSNFQTFKIKMSEIVFQKFVEFSALDIQ